ncbi:hypothetical protein RQP46_003499 [Phenoliferia psychrophenolica]
MGKHDRSDSEDTVASPANRQRRATTGGSTSLAPSSPATTEGGSEEDEDMVMAQDAEQELWERHRNRRAPAATNGEPTGRIAQAGIIMKVTLVNFMSHLYKVVEFGEQINFITGNNGAGKSAILTGISMALGGSAKSTGRAANAQDNCMTILTQDNARQFLAASSPKDKYNMFLRGTQLAQLTEEYELLASNTEKIAAELVRKKESLGEIEDTYSEAKERAKEAELAQGHQERLKALKDELAWVKVGEVENRLSESKSKLAVEEAKAPELERLAQEAEHSLQALEETHAALQGQSNEALAPDHDAQIQKLQTRITEHKAEMKKKNDTARTNATLVARSQETVDGYRDELENEKAKLASTVKTDLQPLHAEIARLTEERPAVEGERRSAVTEAGEASDELDRVSEELRQVRDSASQANRDIKRLENRIENLNSSKTDALANYEGAARLLKLIDGQRWTGTKPFGPVGLFVKIKDPLYAPLLESHLGPNLDAFITSNQSDYLTLRQLSQRIKGSAPIARFQLDDPRKFNDDLSRSEPHSSILTVLRNLEFQGLGLDTEAGRTAQAVRQYLVVKASIETAALVPRRFDGDKLMRSDPRNVAAAYSADMFKLTGSSQHAGSTALYKRKDNSRLGLDVGQQVSAIQREIHDARQELQYHKQKQSELDGRLRTLQGRKQAATGRVGNADRQLQAIKARIQQLEDRLSVDEDDAAPTRVSALEQELADGLAELASLQAQTRDFEKSRDTTFQSIKPVVLEKERLQGVAREAVAKLQTITAKLEKASDDIIAAKKAVVASQRHLEACQGRIQQLQQAVDAREVELETCVEEAVAKCNRPPVGQRKSGAALQKELATLEKALRERQKRQGASVEQILAEYKRLKKVVLEARGVVLEIQTLRDNLAEATEERRLHWHVRRKEICARAIELFEEHLAKRGFMGTLLFEHPGKRKEGRLSLQVQTDDHVKGAKIKDIRSLSGGEKSYSTVCFLLSMWDSISGPLRCLDEFDVFMDDVNRFKSMRMLIDGAVQADSKQFIIITPLQVGAQWGPEVTVTVVEDPDRESGSLASARR